MTFAHRTFPLLVIAAAVAGCATEASGTPETTDDDLTRAECRGAPGEAEPACRVEAVVEHQVVVHLDPAVLAETCVTFVLAGSRRYGLLQPPAACADPSRFDGANIHVSFSKGALETLSKSKRAALKGYDANATYYDLSGPLREAPFDALAAFDALDAHHKVEALFTVAPGGSWATLRPAFEKKDIRILDTFEGDLQRAALDEYYDLRDFAFGNGGDRPDVYAIQREGVTYAYAMEASGRAFGNWGEMRIYDRSFTELNRFGFSD